jgi:effector-binding domain-containing protein
MRRFFFLGLILALGALYYLFVRPYEFEINFRAKTHPGDVIETIRIWNRALKGSEILGVDSFTRVDQRLTKDNRTYIYRWNFNPLNDSVTKVNIQISEPGRELLNKLLVPFTQQNIEVDGGAVGKEFYEILIHHLEITNVKIIGEAQLDSVFCACRSNIETTQIEKANGMMRDYPLLSFFLAESGLKPKGLPVVRILKWNHSKGMLRYDFCFPIEPTDSLPENVPLEFKKLGALRALKAEYNGNYITSDRAWYELIEYANKNGYKVTGLPVEYFFNNPNLGGNERNWKTEVYLPIE